VTPIIPSLEAPIRHSAAAFVMISILGLAACTSHAAPQERTTTRTITHSAIPVTPDRSIVPPAATVAPLPPGRNATGEKDARCPYIHTGLNQEQTALPNMTDLEGNRIYRTTILTRLTPVGCRFYFIHAPFEATADIEPYRFATAAQARRAMIDVATSGRDANGRPNFAAGVDGILFRTSFFGPDGGRDWAFVFAKGRTLVIVHTQETKNSLSAELIAEAIVGRFTT
jgi:hypothetical protein